MNIKKLIKSADLMVAEFALLAGVSRVTVHAWMNGAEINVLRKPRIDKLVTAVERGIEAGDFPMGDKRSRSRGTKEAREKLLKQIVIKHLAAPKKTV